MDFEKYKKMFIQSVNNIVNRSKKIIDPDNVSLDFDNRTFNATILEQFRATYEAYSSCPSDLTARNYGLFFRYHFIGDTAMAPLAEYYADYIDEICRQLLHNPDAVLGCGGAWLYLKDLPEDLMDSEDPVLEKKALMLGKMMESLTGESIIPAWYINMDELVVPMEAIPSRFHALYTALYRIGIAFYKRPGRLTGTMEQFRNLVQDAGQERRVELIDFLLASDGFDGYAFTEAGVSILLYEAGCDMEPYLAELVKKGEK